MTMGTMAITRLSTAAVVQVVLHIDSKYLITRPEKRVIQSYQPLFDAPAITKLSMFIKPIDGANAWIVSIALTAAFVMGKRSNQVGSEVSLKKCLQV